MELALLVYLIGFIEKLDYFLKGSFTVAVILIVLCTMAFIIVKSDMLDVDETFYKHLKTVTKTSLIAIVVSVVLALFTPSKNTFTMMIGAYAGQKVIEHPKTSELFDKSLKAIETQLDVLIAPPKKEEKGG